MLTAILRSIDDGLTEQVWGLMGIDRNFAMAVSFHIHVDVTGCMMAQLRGPTGPEDQKANTENHDRPL